VSDLTIRLAVYALLASVCFGAGWTVQGWRKDTQIADVAYEAQAARSDAIANAKAIEDAQAAGQAFAEALAVEREAKTRVVKTEITRDVIKYVQRASSQSACSGLDADGVRLINTSATGRMPTDTFATSAPDARAAGVTAAAVVASVTGNYGVCNDNANQLRALQDWVRTLKQ